MVDSGDLSGNERFLLREFDNHEKFVHVQMCTYIGSNSEYEYSPMRIGSNIENGDRTLHKPNTYWI